MADVADIALQTIIGTLRELAPSLHSAGVIRLWVFGSRARGNARPDSDLDILVETAPMFDHFRVAHLIEDALGLQVQLSIRPLLKPRIAERIADDLVEVF